jgi:hopanoid C-3 methylase
MKHTYATFTVLTPLPGTELYNRRQAELLSRKPELYDMLHALLPPTLPMQEFYRELAKLWTKAVPMHRVLPTLFHFGLHGMLGRLKLFGRVLVKCGSLHLDY